ncbi:MAG: hypothetical protein K2O18_09275 [Oscillospiraceae bacterium]|nr:hypothetical protein [Oscillospiraceae bacterium]
MSAKLTIKSTKQELLDALRDAEKRLKEQQQIISDPSAAAEKAEAEGIIRSAAADVESGIFSTEMTEKYQNLAKAIRLQEAKLKASYDIEAALIDMNTVINARKQAQMDLDTELAQARTEARTVTEALNAENKRLKADLDAARKREQEEYDYDQARKRKQQADKYADELSAMEKRVSDAAEKLDALQADAAAIEALRARVDGLPEELALQYQGGFDDGKKEAGKEYGYKSSLAEKEHSFELRERDGRIERLEKEAAEKSDKITALEAKLDAAYAQLRDLAAKTVEASGGVKVISTSGDGGSVRK